jgi:hypothetical protein
MPNESLGKDDFTPIVSFFLEGQNCHYTALITKKLLDQRHIFLLLRATK